MSIPYPNPLTWIPWNAPMYGWICPRCGRVYGPNWQPCLTCNMSPVPPQTVTIKPQDGNQEKANG